jgi:hypothetical protein
LKRICKIFLNLNLKVKKGIFMADVTKFFDKKHEQKEFSELADAPIDAIAGITPADANALKQALNIETIRDLAENRFVLTAQAVMAFSRASKK